MATKLTPAQKALLSVCREILDKMIGDRSKNVEGDSEVVLHEKTRYRMKDRVMVDSAVGDMFAKILTEHFDLLHEVKDLMPVWRESYHHAVNAYFRLYFDRGRGRPPLSKQELERLLTEEKAGTDRATMAQTRNLDVRTGRDTIRKRLGTAKKRLPTAGK